MRAVDGAARGGSSSRPATATESTAWVTGVEERLTSTSIAVVERRGEQQSLPVRRGRVEEPRDGGQEAEVGHVVGLVEHGDLDRVEAAVALLDQVLEPAGAGETMSTPSRSAADLRVLADAAEDGRW